MSSLSHLLAVSVVSNLKDINVINLFSSKITWCDPLRFQIIFGLWISDARSEEIHGQCEASWNQVKSC